MLPRAKTGSKRLHRCKLPPAQHVPNELTESFDHWEGRFLRDLSSHRRRSVRGGRLGLVKGCPHVLHAAWLWPPPATPGSLKPHVEEPLRVCRILNARTSVALCIRGKRKAEHARPCVCSRSRQPAVLPLLRRALCVRIAGDQSACIGASCPPRSMSLMNYRVLRSLGRTFL